MGVGETSVTLVDDVPPTLVVTATPGSLWPPNHRMRDIHVEPQVDDDCDADPAVVLAGVASSEPPDERGDGSFQPDIEGADIGMPDFDFLLRAERSGHGRGRQYTATYTAMDAQGNATDATVTVGVAHDQGRRR